MNRAPLDQHARDWFACGYRLRVKDVDAGQTLTDREGNQFFVVDRTTAADGTHRLHTRHGGIERVQTFGPYDDLDAFYAETVEAAGPSRH